MLMEEASAGDPAILNGEGAYVDGAQFASRDTLTQQPLQQESYHRPITAVVGPEATNERATVIAEDVSGSDGTLRTTLRKWAGRQGPVTYNKWQSVFWMLRRDYALDEPDLEGATQSQIQSRMKTLYQDIMVECHGEDFRAELARIAKAVRAAEPGASRMPKTIEQLNRGVGGTLLGIAPTPGDGSVNGRVGAVSGLGTGCSASGDRTADARAQAEMVQIMAP